MPVNGLWHLSVWVSLPLEVENAVTYPFWEGALENDPKLLKLVRLLEMV